MNPLALLRRPSLLASVAAHGAALAAVGWGGVAPREPSPSVEVGFVAVEPSQPTALEEPVPADASVPGEVSQALAAPETAEPVEPSDVMAEVVGPPEVSLHAPAPPAIALVLDRGAVGLRVAPRRAQAAVARAAGPSLARASFARGGTGFAPSVARAGNAPPEYPVAAAARGVEGDVVLVLTVREDGSVADVAVEASSGDATLDAAAARAAWGWRYRPATRDGDPVPERLRVPVRFRLRP